MSKNIAASVGQRLRNLSRQRNEDFGLALTKYGLERVLFRLSRSKHRHRPTRDVDFLAYGPNDVERFVSIFQEICSDETGEDGLTFQIDAIAGERIKEDADYQGIRINFVAYLGNIRIPVQIDLGFGDIVTPEPVQVEYSTLLTLPAAILSAYPRETVVASRGSWRTWFLR
jgi:hypothetical protein